MLRPLYIYNNIFETVTRGSNEKGITLTGYTTAVLGGPNGHPDLQTLLKPDNDAYIAMYNAMHAQLAKQKAATATLNDLLDGLIPSAAQWDLDVQRVYAKGTPEYIAIFPKGRSPFNSGKQEKRINGVAQLSLRIGTDVQLAAVKTQVDGYYTALLSASTAQKEEKGLTDAKSDALEAARITACETMQEVLGALMRIYKSNPLDMERFFLNNLLRRQPQKDFTGRVAINSKKDIMKRKMDITTMLKIKNLGLTTLYFYLSPTKDGILPVGAIPFAIPANTTEQVAATQLGDLANSYLIVLNTSEISVGEWAVEM